MQALRRPASPMPHIRHERHGVVVATRKKVQKGA
jgi:hypothetical protein